MSFRCLAASMALLMLASCAGVRSGRPPASALSLVPAPEGYSVDESYASTWIEDDSVRVGSWQYVAVDDLTDPSGFYLQAMPHLGWGDAAWSPDRTAMTFYKEGQECVLTVRKEGRITRIQVDLRGPAR